MRGLLYVHPSHRVFTFSYEVRDSQNAGQNCIGIERLIVHSSQYDEIYANIVERTKQLRLGSALSQPQDGFVPTVDCGAMINHGRFNDLERVLETAENHGATIDAGGRRWKHPYLENGAYFSPTVVGNVDPASELAQRESKYDIDLQRHL